MPVTAVADDASPRGAVTFGLWEPPLTALRGEHDAPVRRAAGAEAARLLADLVVEGARTLAFVRSRRGAELTTLTAQRHLAEAGAGALVARIAAYRAGYLPEERRALEAALSSGRLLGVASTNALELGLDVSGLDAVVLAGFPGTLASLWQQAGRAGRSGAAALVLFVARDDPLDTYLVHHPEAVFGRPIEASVFDPENPYVLGPQLCCAAAELPLRADELGSFGASAPAVLDQLVERGLLRRRPSGWYWTARDRPAADIRGSGGPPVAVVEKADGSLIGTVDAGAAHGTVHDGAVYLHQGRSYVVDAFDVDDAVALVHADEPDWSTSARDITDIAIVATTTVAQHGPVSVAFGTVDVTNQTVSYLRRRISTNEILDETPLDLPPRELRTRAVWYCIPQEALDEIELFAPDVPGAAHAAEHAAIGLLPLFATCDRWDIGGVSTALHPDTGTPDRLRLRRRGRRGGVRRTRARRAAAVAAGHPRGDRRVRVRLRLPVVRAVAEVRQRQRAVGQARRGAAARSRAGAPSPILTQPAGPLGRAPSPRARRPGAAGQWRSPARRPSRCDRRGRARPGNARSWRCWLRREREPSRTAHRSVRSGWRRPARRSRLPPRRGAEQAPRASATR